MNRVLRSISLSLAGSSMLFQTVARADVSYQETTQINGGSVTDVLKLAGTFSSKAKQLSVPTTSSITIHNQRMVRANPQMTQIIDLDQRTITYIDHEKHTYSIVTFEQLTQAMAKGAASRKSSKQSDGDQANQMKLDAHISQSGATREIDGKKAKEALLTMTMLANANDGSNVQAGMAATMEMWLIDSAPGMEEMRAFSTRMAKELGVEAANSPVAALLASKPGATQALAGLQKEAAAMTGVPVLQITRVGLSADGKPIPAPSVAPLPAQSKTDSNKSGEITREIATEAGTETANDQISKLGVFGRALGNASLGSLMRHKPASSTSSAKDHSAADPATASILLEMQTAMSNFSTHPANLAAFELPIGYKQVPSAMSR